MGPVDGGDKSGTRHSGGYDPFAARRARVLDPGRVTRRGDQTLEPTVYVSDRILVAGVPASRGVRDFQRFAEGEGISAQPDPRNESPPEDGSADARIWVTPLVLAPSREAMVVDAWRS